MRDANRMTSGTAAGSATGGSDGQSSGRSSGRSSAMSDVMWGLIEILPSSMRPSRRSSPAPNEPPSPQRGHNASPAFHKSPVSVIHELDDTSIGGPRSFTMIPPPHASTPDAIRATSTTPP